MSAQKNRRRVLGATALVAALLATGCGGEQEPAATDRERPAATAAPAGGSETVAPTIDIGIDVEGSPAVVIQGPGGVEFAADLGEASELRVETQPGEVVTLSPDATVAAVTRSGGSGSGSGSSEVELVSTESGSSLHTFEVEGGAVSVAGWSPDSSALVVRASSGHIVLRTDGSETDLGGQVLRKPVWTMGGDGAATVVMCERCALTQVVGSDGTPIAVGTNTEASNDARSGVIDATGGVTPFPGAWGASQPVFSECADFTYVGGSVGARPLTAVYDVDEATFVEVEQASGNGQCPIPAPDRSKVAVALTSGGAAVVDLATGASTTVATEGIPMAWSEDGGTVLVYGSGTVLAPADGSGSAAASVELDALCALGASGKVLGTVAEEANAGLVLYDIGADEATKVGAQSIAENCQVSADGSWALNGTVLVDLDKGVGASVSRPVNLGAGTWTVVEASSTSLRIGRRR